MSFCWVSCGGCDCGEFFVVLKLCMVFELELRAAFAPGWRFGHQSGTVRLELERNLTNRDQ